MKLHPRVVCCFMPKGYRRNVIWQVRPMLGGMVPHLSLDTSNRVKDRIGRERAPDTVVSTKDTHL